VRRASDLIRELQEEAASGRFIAVALAVGFEDLTEFIFSADPNALEKLNDSIRQGGIPHGLLGVRPDGEIAARSLEQFSGAEAMIMDEYLDRICAAFAAKLEADGIARVVSDTN
jgi:hypothetical protein